MKNTPDALSEDMDLYKRIQVLQQINPAIKALMNYRGKHCRLLIRVSFEKFK